ncbi:hypothetical protein BDZ45DRAFT_215229 [Acephala macrosclerotiorum]|nr:hypothetical protein BDZ45DRAFT_215229 [Acephala macrosclerotiorum]
MPYHSSQERRGLDPNSLVRKRTGQTLTHFPRSSHRAGFGRFGIKLNFIILLTLDFTSSWYFSGMEVLGSRERKIWNLKSHVRQAFWPPIIPRKLLKMAVSIARSAREISASYLPSRSSAPFLPLTLLIKREKNTPRRRDQLLSGSQPIMEGGLIFLPVTTFT